MIIPPFEAVSQKVLREKVQTKSKNDKNMTIL